MRNLFLTTIALSFLTTASRAQDLPKARIERIKSFLYDVHQTDLKPAEIVKKHIWFDPSFKEETVLRQQQAALFLDEYLRQKKNGCAQCEACQNCKIVFDEQRQQILPYVKLGKIQHVNFDRANNLKNIYAVAENNKVLQYFYFKGDKTASFFYFTEGDTSFFFTF